MKIFRTFEILQKPNDKIELRGLNQSVRWGELDRWNYTDVATPPPYTLYTFLTLKEAFQVFLIIMGAHTLLMLIVKMFTSTQFRTKTNLLGKFIHIIQNLRDVIKNILTIQRIILDYLEFFTFCKNYFLRPLAI